MTAGAVSTTDAADGMARPGSRVVADAHNCYPYDGHWADRIQRALAAGTPVAIEQDLALYDNPQTGATTVLSHNHLTNSDDPQLRTYFFEALRPTIEQALRTGNQGNWPLVTLNLDLKSVQPQHLVTIWKVLSAYQDWLTTAPRTANINGVQPLSMGPILVLTAASDLQKKVFYDDVPVGGKLLVFGAVRAHRPAPGTLAAAPLLPDPADNYRRWWDNSWSVIEPGGPSAAGAWSAAKAARLDAMVEAAHANGLWIRFYTLDGASRAEMRCHGWLQHYNFGSLSRAEIRWRAAAAAGVDYIASDQYGELAGMLRGGSVDAPPRSGKMAIDGQSYGSCRSYPALDGLGLDLRRVFVGLAG